MQRVSLHRLHELYVLSPPFPCATINHPPIEVGQVFGVAPELRPVLQPVAVVRVRRQAAKEEMQTRSRFSGERRQGGAEREALGTDMAP